MDIKYLSDELIELFRYVENSDEKIAKNSKGTIVKNIHKRLALVKNDVRVKVEFVTLLEGMGRSLKKEELKQLKKE